MAKDLTKNMVIAALSVVIFFTMLEMTQRIRYFLKYHSTYWLCYGFSPKPKNYDAMLENAIIGNGSDIQNIEAIVENYDGYYKYNPKSPNLKERINSNGFRGNEIGVKDRYRIVTLGGSTTFGAGVGNEETYPAHLARRTGTGYEVINAGVDGLDTANIVKLFKNEIVPLKPDMVIVNSVVNNFLSSPNTCKFNRLRRLNLILMGKSLFYMTLREKIRIMEKRLIVDIYRGGLDDVVNAFLNDKAFYGALKQEYESIVRIAQANHIKLVIIKEPAWINSNRGMIFEEKFKPIWDRTYNILDEVGKEHGIEVLDVDIPKNEEYFIDGVHLTSKGNAYLADIIYKAVFK